ncbi:hypothetical protein J5226_05550 [Lysobacter sp. K5869]|uniref:hypothetical protein n=1 Tax=Lysobacter sp. K5869 TaxID=2820808 RepID=UPI001C05F7E3|nr:hypothetical protein [Lysobacter sp. K5869]QWP77870.1 hypothetical protein J5226_05550 [Lysobacter sp. K5869]
MSTIRHNSANEDAKRAQQAAQDAQLAERRHAAHEPAPPESVDQFRNLMQQRQALGQKGEQTTGAQPEDGQYAAGDQAAQSQTLRDRQQNALERGRNQYAQDQSAQSHAAQGQARQQTVEQKSRDEQRYSVGFDRGDAGQPSSEQSGLWLAQQAMRAEQAAPMQAPAPTSNAAAFAELIERHVRQLAVSSGGADGENGQVLLRLSDQTLPGTDLLLSKTADGWQLRADSRSRSSYDAIREAGPELMRRFAARNLGQLSIDPHFHD